MDFTLKPLPYSKNALEPHLGKETLSLHYEKHHAGYLKKLKKLIEGKPEANESLEWILCSAEGPVFENAAQVWNHDFYWRSMHPDGGGTPDDALGDAVEVCFGGLDGLRKIFLQAGKDHFGSGWLWLIGDRGRLRVTTTHDANLPLRYGQVPLVTADLWEHAYYLDYHNERARYLEAFFDHLINWEFAASNWTAAATAPATVVRRNGVTS
jgi:Fe-Mn family superoxide dismutase